MTNARSTDPALEVGVRLFARYAELFDTGYLTVTLPPGATVDDAIAALRFRPGGDRLPHRLLVARNLEQVAGDEPLETGDELALLPPMAGG